MPSNPKQLDEKLTKTASLFGFANLALSPLYFLDARLGLTASIATNTFMLYQLHDLGKRRRPGSNTLNKINTFFASQSEVESLEVQNSLRNLINGGDAIYNEIENSLKLKK